MYAQGVIGARRPVGSKSTPASPQNAANEYKSGVNVMTSVLGNPLVEYARELLPYRSYLSIYSDAEHKSVPVFGVYSAGLARE